MATVDGTIDGLTKRKPKDDMTWGEVFDLGKRYMRIPAVLIVVEALYWFLTQPSDTLAIIQVVEAWIWHNCNIILFGEGSSMLSTHNGWWTKVTLTHSNFYLNRIDLYVSDECAGVHEMLFISTLVIVTDGVPQKLKIKSVAVLSSIVFLLNIVRLVLLYPMARMGCDKDPNGSMCEVPMWEFHYIVFEWGFLIVLVLIWTCWFYFIGGPNRVRKAAALEKKSFYLEFRRKFSKIHCLIISIAIILAVLSVMNFMTQEVEEASAELEDCEVLDEISQRCTTAQNQWDNAISTAWSLGTISLLLLVFTLIRINKKPMPSNSDEES